MKMEVEIDSKERAETRPEQVGASFGEGFGQEELNFDFVSHFTPSPSSFSQNSS